MHFQPFILRGDVKMLLMIIIWWIFIICGLSHYGKRCYTFCSCWVVLKKDNNSSYTPQRGNCDDYFMGVISALAAVIIDKIGL